MRSIKHLLNRILGTGPHRVASFAEVIATRRNPKRGVLNQPENFDGIMRAEPGDVAVYSLGRSLLGQPDHSEIIAGHPRYLTSGVAPTKEKIAFSLSNASAISLEGVVYCSLSRTAVAESMRAWFTGIEENPVLSAPRFPASKPLPGCSLNLSLLSAEGFYHFLVEALPRLWFMRGHLPQVRHVLVNGMPGSFHEKWLVRAGLDPAQLIQMQAHSHYCCEQMLFTNYLMGEYQPTPWIVSALRELLDAAPPSIPGQRRLWLSRTDAHSRQPRWESALLAKLSGFELVTLATLSPAEQIGLMREASVVAGPHGAGFSNLVFCAPGTKVVEIFHSANRQPIYSRIANVCRLPYAWAIADFTSNEPSTELTASMKEFIDC